MAAKKTETQTDGQTDGHKDKCHKACYFANKVKFYLPQTKCNFVSFFFVATADIVRNSRQVIVWNPFIIS